jgi:hypothetical protein
VKYSFCTSITIRARRGMVFPPFGLLMEEILRPEPASQQWPGSQYTIQSGHA